MRQEQIRLRKAAKEKKRKKAYEKAYEKAWSSAHAFRDMHREAYLWLVNNYHYSLRWEAEQMGLEWPRYRFFLWNEYAMVYIPLSQFMAVEGRFEERILFIEEQMRRILEQQEREDGERVRTP